MRKKLQSIGYALAGYKHAFTHDSNFRWEMCVGSLFYFALGYFAWPLTQIEFLFLTLSYILILVTELVNTAFERALERLHPERHELIGISKDIAASAVLLSAVFALVVCVVVVYNRLF